MSEQQNVDVVRRGYEAFGRGDIEALLSLLDEQVEWLTPGPADLPTAGSRRGREEVRAFFGALSDLVDIQTFAPETFVAQGEHVVVLGTNTSRVKASGNLVTEAWAHTFVVHNGKIARFQEYLDTAAIVTELRGAPARA
jgi:ketosteroid isomerase-like protein